jgi:hypothetical protein
VSESWTFEAGEDEAIQCQWFVPDDFDSGGTGPQIHLRGWLTALDDCGSTCTTDGVVEWEVSRRVFSVGDLVFFEIKRLGSTGLDDNIRVRFHLLPPRFDHSVD